MHLRHLFFEPVMNTDWFFYLCLSVVLILSRSSKVPFQAQGNHVAEYLGGGVAGKDGIQVMEV